MVVVNLTNKEEDPKKDLEEVENTKGFEDSKDPMNSNELEYHKDLKDFDPWDG